MQATCWINGQLENKPKVGVDAFSLHYGFSLFDSIRIVENSNGRVLLDLDQHIDRFLQGMRLMRMTHPFTKPDLQKAHYEIVDTNADCTYLRLLAYFGQSQGGFDIIDLEPTIAILPFPWSAPSKRKPRALKIVSGYPKPIERLLTLKSSSHYTYSILALNQAKHEGYDDILMIDADGCICEASVTNMFVVRNGTLLTPSNRYCLPGITRDRICDLAVKNNIPVHQTTLTRDDIYQADELFLTGTASGLIPVASVDGFEFEGSRPIFDTLSDAYSHYQSTRQRP